MSAQGSLKADHRIVRCRTCQAPIIFLRTQRGSMMPTNADSVLPEDTEFEFGRHVSHFADCAQADKHRRPR
jgi:hypothetical protein